MAMSERIELWPNGTPNRLGTGEEDRPWMETCVLNRAEPTAAVIVCPGGGYARRAEHEGKPVAEWLNRIGVSAFVLHYRVSPYRHPNPLMDARRAIRLVRSRAEEWNLDPDRIGILGFSAGGHLAASAGILNGEHPFDADDTLSHISARPNLMILCYPVISFQSFAHTGSRDHLLGESPSAEAIRELSLETRVGSDTPPAFIWHTSDDAAVPVENSLNLAMALSRHRIPFDLHSYESGKHGLGLASEHAEARTWTDVCGLWLKKHGFGS